MFSAGLKTGGVTSAIPGSDRRAWCTRSTAPRSAAVGTSTTTWIGPLKPGPKPAARWSYATRWVVCVAALPSSGVPIRMLRDGTAMAQSRPRPTTA